MADKHPSYKASFPPIGYADTEILILGTLPGDTSLRSGEYFAHPRNRFWKIIAAISNNPVPKNLSEKLELLESTRIGLLNVLYKARRKGSLDSAIHDEIPNDLPSFIATHKKLRVIAFDGRKAEALYDKYFSRNPRIIYLSLPGCSPANARFSLQALCERWGEIFGSS